MNPKELEVLKVLLHSDIPLSLPDILKLHPTMVKSTVAATLAKLLKEEMIEVAGIGHSGRVICRTYRPTKQSQDVLIQNFAKDYNDISDIVSKVDLCLSLLKMNKDPEKAKEEIAMLRAMLDKFERENGLDDTREQEEK